MNLKNIKQHAGFIVLSLAAHVMVMYPAVTPGVLDFNKPVNPPQAVMVEIDPAAIVPAPHPVISQQASLSRPVVAPPEESFKLPPAGPVVDEVEEKFQEIPVERPDVPEDLPPVPVAPTPGKQVKQEPAMPVAAPRPTPVIQPPLRKVEEFIGFERETLTYQVNLRGVPVGSAVLEASSAGGEFRISLKMNSGPALSTLYPVHNQIETRHIGGNFIITKIRRQEGSRRSDNGFTISLRDRSVFWVDLLKRRSSMEKIPTSDVLDPFSALYYLRNRTLQVGKTEVLHVYDGDSYAELPVEVLRSELIHLPGKGDTQTLVLKPQLRNEAVFHRTGEMLVWVTADEFKVPVKVETSILLGKVTAELVAAETASLPSSRPESLQ